MKTMMAMMLAVVYVGTPPCYAASPQMGTWSLNEAKSKLNPKGAKITKTVYASVGGQVKITLDGIGADGRPMHDEWMGKLDGQDYPVVGDPRSDMRSYETLDEQTLELTVKKAGSVVTHGFIVISADGTTRTTLAMVGAPGGKNVPFIAVYDKQ